jgi:hypothetical protein
MRSLLSRKHHPMLLHSNLTSVYHILQGTRLVFCALTRSIRHPEIGEILIPSEECANFDLAGAVGEQALAVIGGKPGMD